MRFMLPHPAMPSGGHVYNGKILESGLLPLEPVYVGPGTAVQVPAGDGWILWDSLLMDRIAEVAGRHALLVHYLPSRDPLLLPATRTALRSREDVAAHAVEAFITTGRGTGHELGSRYPGKPVFVCEPGIDPAFPAARARRSPLSARCLNLLTVANLVPAKGHTRILAILNKLLDLDWRWHLVGDPGADPSFTSHWLEEVTRSGLGERIHLVGPLAQGELAGFMEDMDLFLSASSYESYGMALAEAVAAGLPAITTRVGEAERLVHDGVHGFVVDFGDWPRFQDLLRRMLEDPLLRESMTQAEPIAPPRTWEEARQEFAVACRSILALPHDGPRSSR